MKFLNATLCALVGAAMLLAADLPYAGKWKINQSKSDLTSTTITYESLPSGDWQSTADGNTYKFKMDGKEYPDNLGDIAAWKSIDASTWQTTWKLNGKVLATDTLKLAADGSLSVNTKGTRPSGEAIDNTTTFQRVSGGPGLPGKWKTANVKSSSPDVMELAASGADGLAYKVPADNLVCDSKLDGKDYPCTGPTVPPGWTVSMTKAGARALDLSVKNNGKVFYKFNYTVSADGKTMTATGGATGSGEKVKFVYDRQ